MGYGSLIRLEATLMKLQGRFGCFSHEPFIATVCHGQPSVAPITGWVSDLRPQGTMSRVFLLIKPNPFDQTFRFRIRMPLRVAKYALEG